MPTVPRTAQPFPVYPDLVGTLAAAHLRPHAERDATVAHVLATCATYAYADPATHAMIATRLGFDGHTCLCIAQTVDAMYISSVAYLVQSRCGRIVVLSYRGTDPGALATWLGNAEVGAPSQFLSLGDGVEMARVHAGFHQNLRATWWAVLEAVTAALSGRSIVNPDLGVERPLEALYVTGHSLGGALAVLFGLKIIGESPQRPIAECLRAVYTFGQPMVLAGSPPESARALEPRLFRHVISNDPIPALPPAAWGAFAHFGQEFRYVHDHWERAETPVAQLSGLRELRRSALGFIASERTRGTLRYRLDAHGPHHYLAALRPRDRFTEFGDREA